jgi:hypothetical protein
MTRSTLALIAVLLAGSASAQIVIDASDYPVGTNISNAIPGVTLSYITLSSPGEQPSPGTSLSSVLYTATPLSIGSSADGDPNSVLGGPTGGDSFQSLILLQFAQPVSYFSFVALSDSGDPVVADIFNSSGIDVANTIFPQGPCAISNPVSGRCEYLNVGGSYQSSTPISTLMIGSTSAEADILRIRAPEIDSSSAVSALTLLLGSLMVLGSRRPKSAAGGAVSS